jgi:hypothetical protein
MRTLIIPITAGIIFVGALISSAEFDRETLKVMPFLTSFDACKKCHREFEFASKISDPARSCDIFCLTCHKDITQNNHHPSGIKIIGGIDYKFNLSGSEKLACFTCHDLHVGRFDSKSWMAQSLFDSMFKKQKQYNTYYLVIKNDGGQLCQKCH